MANTLAYYATATITAVKVLLHRPRERQSNENRAILGVDRPLGSGIGVVTSLQVVAFSMTGYFCRKKKLGKYFDSLLISSFLQRIKKVFC